MIKTFKNKDKMKKMNKKFRIIIGIIGLLVMTSFISAFGVANSYWDDRPLKIAPGESKIVLMGLQNMVGDEDMTFKANLIDDGGGIASLVDKDLEYSVPLGTEIDVPIQIEIPEDTEIGGRKKIVVSFTQISVGGGGMVSLIGGVVSNFPVEVVVEEESELYVPETKKGLSVFWIVIFSVVVALIILLIAKREKLKELFKRKQASDNF